MQIRRLRIQDELKATYKVCIFTDGLEKDYLWEDFCQRDCRGDSFVTYRETRQDDLYFTVKLETDGISITGQVAASDSSVFDALIAAGNKIAERFEQAFEQGRTFIALLAKERKTRDEITKALVKDIGILYAEVHGKHDSAVALTERVCAAVAPDKEPAYGA